MLHRLCLSLVLLFLAVPSMAQTAKSNSDLFLQCADYDNSFRAIKAQMKSENTEAEYMSDQKRQLENRIDDHEREINRLDEILKIMRNSDNVWAKRDREFQRYTRAFEEYDDFMVGFNRSRQNYQRMIDRSKHLRDELKGQCFGTWSSSILDEYCGQGNSRMQAFCSRFNR